MYKKAFAMGMAVLFLFTFSFLIIGEKEKVNLKEVSSVKIEEENKILYEVILEDSGEIAIYSKNGDEKELVRSKKASPLRENDEEILKDGIVTENLEEALMIFEDFVS